MKYSKYFRVKYILFVLKLIIYKIKFGHKLSTKGIWYGFEKDVEIRIEEGGQITLDTSVYFTKRTDVMAIGGQLTIGNGVSFNKDCTIVTRDKITIGDNCKFGEMTSIYDHNHGFNNPDKLVRNQGYTSAPIKIGRNVWVGGKVFIGKGVTIGNNVVIGANSVVTKDIPDDHIASGIPLKIKPIIWKPSHE